MYFHFVRSTVLSYNNLFLCSTIVSPALFPQMSAWCKDSVIILILLKDDCNSELRFPFGVFEEQTNKI